MPLYDYQCQSCQFIFEHQRRVEFADEPIACPNCNISAGVKRIITKMPLRTYTKRPQDRLWGTSHISSSEKFKEKQKRKGGE